jgi:hypothetical protein
MMAITRKVNMTRITICLPEQEKMASRALAEKEFREPRVQAALIIHQELERRGLLLQEQTGDSTYRSQPVISKPV